MVLYKHQPVMVQETLDLLAPVPGELYLDCTVGGGGHSAAILGKAGGKCRLIGLDQDKDALEAAAERLQAYSRQIQLVQANFGKLKSVLEYLGISKVNGFLYDLGVSSPQLDIPDRGFSYQQDAPLDMRMNINEEVTAADLVNQLPEKDLAVIIRRYGEERWANRIAHQIVQKREQAPLLTTGALVEVIKQAIPAAARRTGPHPARRTFQALRIAVNKELEVLENSLKEAIQVLVPGGRIVVISYHSLEDRIVKNIFRTQTGKCQCPPGLPVCRCEAQPVLKILTARPLGARQEEVLANPRARSAKMRAAVKMAKLPE